MFQNIFATMDKFEIAVIDSVKNIISFCTPYVQAYINTLSMGIGEAPLWSLLVTLILFVEIVRLPMSIHRTVAIAKIEIPAMFAEFKRDTQRMGMMVREMTKPRTTVPTSANK